MELGQDSFIPPSLKMLACFCIFWEDVDDEEGRRYDELAGELWDACDEEGHGLDGIMIGELTDNGTYESFTSEVCQNVELVSGPHRPPVLDEWGREDEYLMDTWDTWDFARRA